MGTGDLFPAFLAGITRAVPTLPTATLSEIRLRRTGELTSFEFAGYSRLAAVWGIQSERLDTIVETAELAQEFKAHRDSAPQSSRSGAKAPPNMNPALCLAHPHSIEIRRSDPSHFRRIKGKRMFTRWVNSQSGMCRVRQTGRARVIPAKNAGNT